MIILLLLFFIIYIISVAVLFYKINVLNDELEKLYDNCFYYFGESFKKENRKNA